MKALALAACLLLLAPTLVWSHQGNVEPDGCHVDHKTGRRHCHKGRETQRNSGGGGGGGRRSYGGDEEYGGDYGGGSGRSGYGIFMPPSTGRSSGYTRRELDSIRRKSNMVQTGGPTGPAQAGTEVKVTDGDTLQVTMNGQRVTVRLYGIDAPEGKQPGGDLCTAALRKLVAGQKLAVVPYGEDRFGRMVAVIYTTALGKTTVNQALLDGGHAWYFTQYCTTPGLCDSWRQSEQRARSARRGIWAKPNPIPPWDWRAGERGGKPQTAAAQPAAPRAADYTLRNSTYACRSIDDALRIYENLERGDLNAATASMKRMLDAGKCSYLPDGAGVDVLGVAKDHEYFKLVRPVGEADSWWVMQDSLIRGK